MPVHTTSKMLWSPAILLLLVGAAFARPQNAWENGKEYTYSVRSRTLSSFNPQSKQYTGIVMEAYVTVQSNGQDVLRAKIWNPKHSQIHTHLENGWESEIPRNQLNLQNLPLSGEPFEIRTKNGVVQDLIVDKNVPTWEVNIIKSIVSQFQVDTQGQNVERSQYNQLPEGDQPYAMFRAMEDSVGGECEVLYDISPVSEQLLQNMPQAVPMPKLREDGEIISVVKTKNYSNCDQRISFHYGLNGQNNWEPGSNENGKHLSRSSISRIFISGNLKKYTIQSSVTRNKVVLSPDQQEHQQGMVASKMNLTLNEVKDISESMLAPANPQSTGNLVYNYNIPIGEPTSRRLNKPKSDRNQQDRRNRERNNRNSGESSYDSSEFKEDRDSYLLPQPKLSEAPQYPLLPYFVGYKGNALYKNNQIDVVASAKRIAQQIGEEFKSPDSMLDAQTLEKFLILTNLVRTMNVEQIAEVHQALYQKGASQNDVHQRSEEEHTRRHIWIAFRDAVAQAGTGPALVNIKRWIQNQHIQGYETANVVDATGRSARTPNSEYLDAFFELVQLKELDSQPKVRYAAIFSFADLIRHAAVNKQSAHNRYPVHVFGRLISKNNRDVQEKYIPYLTEKLKSAVESGDSNKIRAYIIALARTGHPQMLSVFEPYLEGRKQISQYQRLVMVAKLKYLTRTYPKIARSVLYKIYSNSNESYDIRTIAVYLLMHTDPPASMLQRMAENTNYDSNKHVNSAVKSVIESLAQLQSDESNDLLNGARAAVPLLTPERYGPQYSRAIFKSFKNYFTHSELEVEATFVGSEDSLIPKLSSFVFYPTYNGIKGTRIEFGASVSSVEDLFKFIYRQWYTKKNIKNGQKAAHQKYSPENLATMLGINGESPKQIEGVLYAASRSAEQHFAFDNHTLEEIPQYFKQLKDDLKRGLHIDRTRFGNSEIIISFPTETGYPVVYSHNAPFVSSVHGKYQGNYELSSDNKSFGPKSLAGSGKVRFIYGMKDQKRLGFVTPHENQLYAAGVDKNLQVHLPVYSDFEYNNEKNEVRVKVQPNDNKEFRIVQFKTQPFTTKHDLTSLQPIANSEETHTVHKSHALPSHSVVTDEKKQQLFEFNWETLPNGQQEQNYNRNNVMDVASGLARSVASALSFTHERTEYEKYSVKVSPNSDMNAELRVSCDSSITEGNSGSKDSEKRSLNAQAPQLEKSYGQSERKRKLLQQVSRNINSPKAHAVDISLQLGPQSSFSLTTAFAESNVDQKSCGAVYAYTKSRDGKDYFLSAGYEGKHPKEWSMDYENILKYNIPHEFDAKIYTGRGNEENKEHEIRIQGQMKQSEERKNSVRQSYEAQDCNKQKARNGNKMTSACEAVNERASTKDTAEITVTFDKDSHVKYSALKALDVLENYAETYVQIEKNSQNKAEPNKIMISARSSPDDEKFNFAVKTPEGEFKFNDIHVGSKNRFYKNNEKQNNKLPYYQKVTESVCYVDKSEVQTFDHHEYPIELGDCLHVAVTTYPKNNPDSPTQKLEIPENMQFSILIRDSKNGQRDLKITLEDKEVEIYQPEPEDTRVKINGREAEWSSSQSIQEVENGQRLFEIIKLQDRTVKFVSEKVDFMIMYDGQRAKIMVGQRYRNSVRGLCGNYDGEPSNDQLTPKGCQMQKPREYAASYCLINEKCYGPAREYYDKLKSAPCAYETVRPGNVISDEEAGRQSQRNSNQTDYQEGSCMHYRTMVVTSDSEICFSVRPVASCSSKCSPVSMKSKSIQFHCVPRTSASEKVADRVRSGANPDLSQKRVSKIKSYEVPQSCSA